MSAPAGDWPQSVADLLPRCSFPPPGAALFCAVSGGADSLALLVLAVAARCDVTAIHVDHGLRPESAGEAAVVAEAAALLGARFVAEKVSVRPGPNLEARARAARFSVLPDGVATGHTMDDQAETIPVSYTHLDVYKRQPMPPSTTTSETTCGAWPAIPG